MAKKNPTKRGRPTKGEGPKLSNPEEVERLLVEGEVVPDENGEACLLYTSPSPRD